jgi:hypothetical protein
VTDKSGAAAGGVKITAQNVDTQISRETSSDDGGLFTIPLLAPGRYKFSARKTRPSVS